MGSSRSKVVRFPRSVPAPGHESVRHRLDFEETIGLHLDALYRTARALTGDHATAEDLVQEAAIRSFRAWDGLHSPSAVKPWLLRILHRTFLNIMRSKSRRPQLVDIDIEELVSHPLVDLEFRMDSPGEAVSDEMAHALDALPPGFREALWLVDVEELTMAESAAVLGLPLGTVASRVHRARRLLRERLRSARREPRHA